MLKQSYIFSCLAAMVMVPTAAFSQSMSGELNQQRLVAGNTTIETSTDIGIGENPNLPVVQVIKQDFPAAKGWRIIWSGGTYSSENWMKVQSIFSTITGAVNSVQYLNSTSWGNTDNADMMLYFGDLEATSEIPQLTHNTAKKATKFKLTSMTVNDLENAAKNNPNAFGFIYEFGFDLATTVKQNYKQGQIYVFKTARNQPKYGAVRIVDTHPKLIIEVVVQK